MKAKLDIFLILSLIPMASYSSVLTDQINLSSGTIYKLKEDHKKQSEGCPTELKLNISSDLDPLIITKVSLTDNCSDFKLSLNDFDIPHQHYDNASREVETSITRIYSSGRDHLYLESQTSFISPASGYDDSSVPYEDTTLWKLSFSKSKAKIPELVIKKELFKSPDGPNKWEVVLECAYTSNQEPN